MKFIMSFNTKISIEDFKILLNDSWKTRLGEDLYERKYWEKIIEKINSSIEKGNRVIPEKSCIFLALNSFIPSKFRVLIIGQDPYPTYGFASGFAFSINKEIKKSTRSLERIYQEIDRSFGSNMCEKNKNNGNLQPWIDQGVLLLNTVLTIGTNQDSHKNNGWEQFTGEVLKYLDNSYVFVTIAMGTDAKKVSLMYIEKNRSLVIETGHPSPVNTRTPFIGTDCFVRCNQLLLQNDLMPIQWVF